MQLVIIGSGNVASVLARRILLAGHPILQVFSRTTAHAASLAEELGCEYTDDLNQISRDGDLYLVAISDGALENFALHAPLLLDKLVVHTAGSLSREVLSGITRRNGVLYPLQSLRKETDAQTEIPLLIDAALPEDIRFLTDFAGTFSGQVVLADDETRKKLHLGAVLTNNFSNHLFRLAADYCRLERVDFKLLLPLIHETAVRLKNHNPRNLQTGPAIRNDRETLRKHLEMLNNYPDARELYEVFTKQIQA